MKKIAQNELNRALDVGAEIDSLSRAPFRRALANMLEGQPEVDDIRAFSRRSPDRWAQGVSILAKASGYQDKQVVEHNYFVKLAKMSDSEVEARLEQVRAEVIEGEVVESDNGERGQGESES